MIHQPNKVSIWQYWQEMNRVRDLALKASLVSHILHPDVVWHGFQPLRHLHGPAGISWTSGSATVISCTKTGT